MRKKIIAVLFSLIMSIQLVPINSLAVEMTSEPKDASDVDVAADLSSAVITNQIKSVDTIIQQSKFTGHQGHGFAAERGNNLIDSIKGKNTVVVGDNNVKNGPDRLIINRDGTKIWIQDKYCRTASETINACFDDTGNFRYYDGDGKPMQIEVPGDQYEKAISCMKEKIKAGKVEGVTDVAEAENLVRKGNLTYNQARNLAKAGTVESLTYDAANGVVSAGYAFGISTLLNYSLSRINGVSREEAIKNSAREGFRTGGLVFCSEVVAAQLSKTGMMKVFTPSSEAIVKVLGEDFAAALVRSTGKTVVSELSSEAIASQAAKLLRTHAFTSVVTLIIFSTPDAIDMFQGRISQKQFIKNLSVAGIVVIAGTAGSVAGGAVGTAISPGIGTASGAVIGGVVVGGAASIAANKLADYITDDDADEMYTKVVDNFSQKCEEYLVTEAEASSIMDKLQEKLTDEEYKNIYQNRENPQYIDDLIVPLFEETIEKREKIDTPTEDEMRVQMKQEFQEVVFIH